MSNRIAVIDYGAGNLLNVVNAFAACGANVSVVDEKCDLLSYDKLVLPGVGAFYDGMKALEEKNLIIEITNFVNSGRPYLGICLGMQFLFEKSCEFNDTAGFSMLPGEVVKIPSATATDTLRRVPHIGWSSLNISKTNMSPLFTDITEDDSFYFVHSYMCQPIDKNDISASVDYLGQEIVAAVSKQNIFGAQFHPEKSGKSGLKIIRNFIKL